MRRPPCCTAGRLRSDTDWESVVSDTAGRCGWDDRSEREERMNASMGEVCGWKIVMVTIE